MLHILVDVLCSLHSFSYAHIKIFINPSYTNPDSILKVKLCNFPSFVHIFLILLSFSR
jgi:hypothetical protein